MIYISKNKTIHFAEISDEEKSDDNEAESKEVKKEEVETGGISKDNLQWLRRDPNFEFNKSRRSEYGSYSKDEVDAISEEHKEKFGIDPKLEDNVFYDGGGITGSAYIDIPGVRDAMIGKERRADRDRAALIERCTYLNHHNDGKYDLEAIKQLPDEEVVNMLRAVPVPRMGYEGNPVTPRNFPTKANPLSIVKLDKGRSWKETQNLGGAGYYPNRDSVVIHPFFHSPYMKKNDIQPSASNIYISSGANGLQPSSVYNIIHHEVSHANGIVPVVDMEEYVNIRNNGNVLNSYYYQEEPQKYDFLKNLVKGGRIFTSYTEADPNEYVSFLGVAKDEFQAHHPEITAENIRDFDQFEKLFKENTYTGEHGTVRYKINDRPVSREAYRVWETLKAAPQTREGFRFYNPFVQNRNVNGVNTQQYKGGRLHQRWNQSTVPQGWNYNPSAVG